VNHQTFERTWRFSHEEHACFSVCSLHSPRPQGRAAVYARRGTPRASPRAAQRRCPLPGRLQNAVWWLERDIQCRRFESRTVVPPDRGAARLSAGCAHPPEQTFGPEIKQEDPLDLSI